MHMREDMDLFSGVPGWVSFGVSDSLQRRRRWLASVCCESGGYRGGQCWNGFGVVAPGERCCGWVRGPIGAMQGVPWSPASQMQRRADNRCICKCDLCHNSSVNSV